MYIHKTIYNNSIKKILLTEKLIEGMADHLVGKKLSIYWESVLDADGDGKVRLKDFIHRIKNLEEADTRQRIKAELTTTATGGGY